jgi:nucleotide-binding universal stress UspA family protein
MMFKRILVPLDGSPRAMRALPVAARLARASGGTVVLVQVVTVLVDYSAYSTSAPTLLQETIDAELEVANRYLERVANTDELVGVKVEIMALFGSPAQAILSAASTYPVDLIVMCSHGCTGLKRWVMGSVALKLARYSPVPVLILRQDGPIPAYSRSDATRPLRVLVPLDGSVLAKAAVLPTAQLVTALADQGAGALHFVRVVKLPPDIEKQSKGEGLDPVLREQVLHTAKIYLDSVIRQLREGPLARMKLSITWSVIIENDAAEGIISVAENGEDAEGAGVLGGCDIIAMATHGRGGLQRWAMGSVTERVLGYTRLPVLVVRSHEAETKPVVKAEEPEGIKMPIWAPLK